MALDTLRTHKIRSALTMLGVIGGTMTVIAISSFLTGLREFVLEQTKRFGPDQVFVTKWDNIGIRFSRPSQSERTRKNVTVDDAKAIAELPTVMGVSPTVVVGSFGPAAQPARRQIQRHRSQPANHLRRVVELRPGAKRLYPERAASSFRPSRSTGRRSPSSDTQSPRLYSAGLRRSTKR